MEKFPIINQNAKQQMRKQLVAQTGSQSRSAYQQQQQNKPGEEPPLVIDGHMNMILKMEKLQRRIIELEAENSKLHKHMIQMEKSLETYCGFGSKRPNRGTDVSIQTDVRDSDGALLKAAELRIKRLEEENLVRDKGRHGHYRDNIVSAAVEIGCCDHATVTAEEILALKTKLSRYEQVIATFESSRRSSLATVKTAILKEKNTRKGDIDAIKHHLATFATLLDQTLKVALKRISEVGQENVSSQSSVINQLAKSKRSEELLEARLSDSELQRVKLLAQIATLTSAPPPVSPPLPSRPSTEMRQRQSASLLGLEAAHTGLLNAVKQSAHVQDLIRVAGLREATIGRDRVVIDLKHAREIQSLLLFSLETAEKSLAETAPQTVAKLRDGRTKRLRLLETGAADKKKDLEQRSVDTCVVSAVHLDAFQVKAEKKLAEAEKSYEAAMADLRGQLQASQS